MPFELSKSEQSGKYRICLKANNSQIILTGQSYSQKQGAKNGIESIINNTADGDGQFERLTAKDGSPYFVLKAKNSEVIGTSQMYKSVSAMNKGIASVIKHAQEGKIKDLTV
jgi:uncharacterized protein YegP (UPF0339 family)